MAGKSDLSFDVEVVKGKMAAVEGKFAEFAEALQKINDLMEMNVNRDENSAVFGDCGSAELSAWSENASTFGDFHNNFENWSALVAAVSANNIELNNDVIALYRSTGDTLDGVAEARAASSADGLSEDAARVYGSLLGSDSETSGKWKSYEEAAKDGFSNIMTENEFARRKGAGSSELDEYDTYQDYLDAMYAKYKGPWKSYEDAANAGYSNIMTENEFARRKGAGSSELEQYDTYQDYLDAMHDKYVGKSDDNATPSGDAGDTSTDTEKDGWSSYEEAANAGYSNIMTKNEFARRKGAGSSELEQYDTYQDYLDAMHDKYVGNSSGDSANSGDAANSGDGGTSSTTAHSSFSDSSAGDEMNVSSHEGDNKTLAAPENFDEMKEAMNNHQPIVVKKGHTVVYDQPGYSITMGDENAGDVYYNADSNDIYFVYKEVDGKGYYYQADSAGVPIGNSKPIDVEEYTSASGKGYAKIENRSSFR